MAKLDFDSYEKIRTELFRMRDLCGDLPELKEMDVFKHLSEENKSEISKVEEFLNEVYGTLDICGFDVVEIEKLTNDA